ncbi:hypothetical protein [Kitasatospora azatica]|uniref:hypothetical protein n=1 Tax=Kitasatospora azatica TaxID=58347 RepID=UPI00056647FA|nr:hypothetical protein [Kitasatospora azatica]
MDLQDVVEGASIRPHSGMVFKVVTVREDYAVVTSQVGVRSDVPFSRLRSAYQLARPEEPQLWQHKRSGQVIERLQMITAGYVVRGNELGLYVFNIRPTPRWGRKQMHVTWAELSTNWAPYWNDTVLHADTDGYRLLDDLLRQPKESST